MRPHIRQISLSQSIDVLNYIPEFDERFELTKIKERILDKQYLALGVEVEGILVAVKLGYFLNDKVFYSWLGGVLPRFRLLGLAQSLLNEQEQILAAKNVGEIQVKSMNRYPSMLQMLISNHYQIYDIEPNPNSDFLKVKFRKYLV
ncbi:hypothetical protein [Thalassotalea crassostreae]|uniref:hypothetical protein n=1 Tax=Thalassotalea crassostreae TaxID=1763536 RepID=UPI00083818DB|nr:hypothetical protein [Thalassotalea crassostreae]